MMKLRKKILVFSLLFFFICMTIFMVFKDNVLIDCSKNWALCSIDKQAINPIHNSKQIKIAIIDSGIDEQEARVEIEKRFLHNKYTGDSFGHGTAVASIIASEKSNKDNVEGLYPQAIIYDANILDENGNAKMDEVISAIEWSIDQQVDIINMSFGIENDDSRLHEIVKKAVENKIIIVASAGNTFGMYTEYPAKYEEVLSISAVDENMNLFKYAAKGKIDFVAPGVDIEAARIGSFSEQERLSGTSFATAYATAIIATLLSEEKIDKDNYREILIDYAELPNGKLGNNSYGSGFLKFR